MNDTVRHIVALSGGKDSVTMALALQEKEPENDYEYVCTPTGNELRPMIEHWKRLEVLLGKPIRNLAVKGLKDLIQIQHALPNWRMRWCTRMIKIKPFEEFVRQAAPCVVYVGIRADESGDREGVDYDRIDGVTRRFPMDEWGWTIQDVLNFLDCHSIVIPERTYCAWCFFQTLYEWYLLWRDYPEDWVEGEWCEEFVGHTFRSAGRDTWPASMRNLRGRFEAGDVPKDRRTKRDAMCSVCAR